MYLWRAVLRRLLPILGLDLDIQDLRRRGDRLDKQVEQALEQNPKLKRYVRQLESNLGAREEEEPLRSDEIIKSLEDYLRQRQQPSSEN